MENLDVATLPGGPGGIRPVVAYNFSLLGTSLQKSAQLVLSYPADLNGQIADNGGNPLSLAPYWWDGVNWRVLGRPQIDTTLHTVTTNLAAAGEWICRANGGGRGPVQFHVPGAVRTI